MIYFIIVLLIVFIFLLSDYLVSMSKTRLRNSTMLSSMSGLKINQTILFLTFLLLLCSVFWYRTSTTSYVPFEVKQETGQARIFYKIGNDVYHSDISKVQIIKNIKNAKLSVTKYFNIFGESSRKTIYIEYYLSKNYPIKEELNFERY